MAAQMFIRFKKDLNQPLTLETLSTLFQQGDKNANVLEIELTENGKPVQMLNATVTGQVERADGKRLIMDGKMENGVASVTLEEEAYNVAGHLVGFVRLVSGDVKRTILRFAGKVEAASDGPLLDSSNVIPNVEDLIAMIETMEQGTAEAVAASKSANAAAANAAKKAQDAETAANAANAWADATASGSAIDAGMQPTVEVVTDADGKKEIQFGIPAGVTPRLSFSAVTGPAGSNVLVEQTGTPEQPHVQLTIPRGDTGAVEGVDYYTGNPEPLGTPTPGTANGVARGNHVHPVPDATMIPMGPEDDIAVAAAMGTYMQGQKALQERVEKVETTFQTGTVTVAAQAKTRGYVDVTFKDAFAGTPSVMAVVNSAATNVFDANSKVGVEAITATGCRIVVYRDTDGNGPVRWLAFRL